MSTGTPLIGRIVAVSTRHPVIVVLVAALLAAAAAIYAARHFAMTANAEDLISPKLEWRHRDAEFHVAFPQLAAITNHRLARASSSMISGSTLPP